MDIKAFIDNARQYLAIKDQTALLTSRQSEIKARMLEDIDSVEADDRGHKTVEFDDASLGTIKVTKQRKVIKNLDMDIAETILTKKGIKNTCVKMVPVLDDAAIMAAFYEGYLTEEDIDAMFPAKESFAFIVGVK